jgi:predicted deacylase
MTTLATLRVPAALLAGTAILACAPARTAPGPAAAECCTRTAFQTALGLADRYRVDAITARRFTYDQFWSAVAPSLQPPLRVETIGQSVLGRDLRAVSFGSGPTRVLLWSQMHGDEATATMSLADIFRFLREGEATGLKERLARNLTITFVPMLNPDGAELFQRQNAIGIDVNRDARRLVTPEARTLKQIHDRFKPHFGFNLHDQNARTRAGRSGLASGIALLPPAYDEAKSYNDVRTRARLVAATLATMFAYEIPGRIAKYDDTYNPRAFGDLMAQWGTSTILIESGALPNDPQKQQLRRLNAAAILTILDAIGTRGYEGADPAAYETLPFNAGGAFDLLVRGGLLVLPGKPAMQVDLAINYEDAVARTDGRVRDVGDLDDVIAIDTLDIGGLFLHPATRAVTAGPGGPMLRLGAPAEFDVRRAANPSSELVRRLGTP